VPRSAVLQVARKDLLLESRAAEQLTLFAMLVALVLVVFRVAAEGRPVPVATALWVSLLLSASVALSRSFHAEADHGTLDLLLASPAAPAALFLGKAFAGAAFTFGAALFALVLCAAFFGADFVRDPVALVAFLGLGALGLSVQGAFFSALSARTRTRASLFPVLMIPFALPLFLWATRGTVASSLGAPLLGPAVLADLGLVAAYDALFLVLYTFLAPRALSA